MNRILIVFVIMNILMFLNSCSQEENGPADETKEWIRNSANPVFHDYISEENYEVASDAHVFFDEYDSLKMIYTGGANGKASIKLAIGSSWDNWTKGSSLLYQPGPSGLDIYKETGFYRKSSNGKHQIYYIGYDDENTYESQIYLAEADALRGPYTQFEQPLISRGIIAGKNVYCMTSPSVIEHHGLLYMTFIGWNDSPENVTNVWMIGAISSDEGHNWSDFQIVDARIMMEGQVTKAPDNTFIAVRTGDYENTEAIYYATSTHPFGPWTEEEEPILIQAGAPYEKDECIAPQITIDPLTNKQYLFYTGADHQVGWWIMLAEKK